MVKKAETHILKVRENRTNKQKTVTIPKDADEISTGDYVEVKKHD